MKINKNWNTTFLFEILLDSIQNGFFHQWDFYLIKSFSFILYFDVLLLVMPQVKLVDIFVKDGPLENN